MADLNEAFSIAAFRNTGPFVRQHRDGSLRGVYANLVVDLVNYGANMYYYIYHNERTNIILRQEDDGQVKVFRNLPGQEYKVILKDD